MSKSTKKVDVSKLTTKKYTDRNSPPYHAEAYQGKEKKGNDGKTYTSTKNKANVYTWKLPAKIVYKPTPGEYYKQFKNFKPVIHNTAVITKKLKSLKKDLKKIGIDLLHSKWTRKLIDEGEQFELEYFFTDLGEPKRSYVLHSDRGLYWSSTSKSGIVHLQHQIAKSEVAEFNKVFIKHFPKRTVGFIKNNLAITIKL